MIKIDYEKNLSPNVIMVSDYEGVDRKESELISPTPLKFCEIDFKQNYCFLFGLDLEISDCVKNDDKRYISLDCKCLKISVKK
jgi:hypothetical protein